MYTCSNKNIDWVSIKQILGNYISNRYIKSEYFMFVLKPIDIKSYLSISIEYKHCNLTYLQKLKTKYDTTWIVINKFDSYK